jgi:hypothetical protein
MKNLTVNSSANAEQNLLDKLNRQFNWSITRGNAAIHVVADARNCVVCHTLLDALKTLLKLLEERNLSPSTPRGLQFESSHCERSEIAGRKDSRKQSACFQRC